MSALAWTAAGSLFAWGWLLLGQGFFWRTDQRLPPASAAPGGTTGGEWPDVAVIVPARDEAAVLPLSLPSLLAQDYPGRARVILVDDGSTDGTGELARALAARHQGLALTVTAPGEPGPGWTGKLWALRHGIALARDQGRGRADGEPAAAEADISAEDVGPAAGKDHATRAERVTATGAEHVTREAAPTSYDAAPTPYVTGGTDTRPWGDADGGRARRSFAPEYLLLTDADIAHAPDSLRTLVAAARGHGLDLVSQMARLRVVSGWERLVVPAFVYFFAQLYPFRRVNRPGARTAAAAGGCVLLRAEAARRAGVPESIRQAVIDDVSLARAVQRSGGRIWLGLAEGVESVRPYPRLVDLWRMVARSAYAQLWYSPVVLVGAVVGLALVYLAPPVALLAGVLGGDLVAAVAGGAAWAVMAGSYAPMLRYYGQPVALAALLPYTALLYVLMTVDSAVRHHRGRGAAWKGRTYARPTAAPER
ncbi:glycosyltransferase [Streptomyces sp. NPDC057638]|uniref:glycosyltransferase n=1 Tax=Streptomyces sp. NPDC057638 TaxID=3346190 RepID=UPI00368BA5E6